MNDHKVNKEALTSLMEDLRKLSEKYTFTFDESAPKGPFTAKAVLMKNSETGAMEYIPTELVGMNGFKRKLTVPEGWKPQLLRRATVDLHLVDTRTEETYD